MARSGHTGRKTRSPGPPLRSVMTVIARYARPALALTVALVLVLAALLVSTGPTLAAPSRTVATGDPDPRSGSGARGAPDNPLAGPTWGVYQGKAELAWEPYDRASGDDKAMLGRIALRPKAKWFGRWIPDGDIARKVDAYVANATGGDAEVLVQLTTYRVDPWQGDACRRLPTQAMKESYRRWVDHFVQALDDTHAQVIVQPDGPFQKCAPGGSKVYKRLIAYQVRKLATLPNTTVYIEVGSAGWNHLDPMSVVHLLRGSGIGAARGFHMNVTHYEGVGRQVRFGSRVVERLGVAGFRDKHFTVDTAENGRPFTWRHHQRHHRGDFNNAPACRTRSERHCVTLGIPPTADVANPAWGLPDAVRALARRHVDAYVWAGRPWLYLQSTPFLRDRAILLARTTPFPSYPD